MVLRLAAALDVPLRDTNDLLRASGHQEAYQEPGFEAVLDGPLGQAVDRMLKSHEPYPMVVVNRTYDMVRGNSGAQWLLERFVADPAGLVPPANLCRFIFDPRLARPFVENFDVIATTVLLRLHRETLHDPRNRALRALQDELRGMLGSAEHTVDLGSSSEPTFTLTLRRDDLRVSLFGTVTVFNAPQNVTLEELRLESFFPNDAESEAAFR